MRNMFVSYKGGAISRAGYQYVGMCKQGAPNNGGTSTNNPPRDINFQYNINQGFALEFGDQYMRVKFQGAYVTETGTNISAATNANPLVITDNAHGYANGDWLYITNMGGMTQLNGLTWVVTNKTTNTYRLTDLFGNAVDSTAFGVYTSGGTAARIYTVVSPYAAIDLPYLKFTQSANTMNLACWNQQTNTEYPPYNLQRIAQTNWVFTQVSFVAQISPPINVVSTATNSTTQNTWYSYVVTAVDALGNESSASLNTDVLNNDIAVNAGSNTIQYSNVVNAVTYNIYAAIPAFTTTPFANPGFIGVTYGLIGTSFGQQFIDTNIAPDFTRTPPLHSNPFARGAINDVVPTASGSGLVQSTTTYTITTSTGSGFVGQPIVQNGNLVGFNIQNSGENYANTDTMAILTGATTATGTYTFTANPTNNQNIVLNGVVWTFVTTPSAPAQTKIGIDLATSLMQLAFDLSLSNNSALTVASYSIVTGTQLNVKYGQMGVAGNSYTLAAGTYGGVVSGATLSGGSNGTLSSAEVSLTIGPQTGTYPGVVQYFQQRLVYADTIAQPDTYFMSRPGLYANFDASIPTVDSDSITGTPWGVQVNGIQFMIPTITGLLTFMGNGVWLISGGSSIAITPSNQNAQAQAQIGCSAILPPLFINLHILYVQAKNSTVRDIAYSFLYNVFQGTDITVFSNHLFFGYTLVQWAYAEEPFKIIWAVRNDGVMLSLTYVKEQEIEGWARHDTNGFFVGVCSVIEQPATEGISLNIEPPTDAVYAITKRYITGQGVWVYYSERANNRIWKNVEDSFCVDAGLVLPLAYPDATLTPVAVRGTSNISATIPLNGGHNYTNPSALAFDSTGMGTGATFSVTIFEGAITSITPISQGQDYTVGATQIIITDSTGADAIFQPIITNNVVFIASSPVFTSDMVGSIIRVDGGKATITTYVSDIQVIADITQTLTNVITDDPNSMPIPAIPNTWSIGNPITVVRGLNHLEGMEVTGLADGGVIVPQIVTDGAITLQNAASCVTVGLPFICQLQTFYLEVPAQTTAQGKRANISAVTVRVQDSRGFSCGVNQPDASFQPNNATIPWIGMKEVKERNALINAGSNIPLFTGDTTPQLVLGEWNERKQVAIQQINPLPLTVNALIPRLNLGDGNG